MTRLLELSIALCVLLTCTALVALMAVFIGFSGPGVERLLAVQTEAVMPAALFLLWPTLWFAMRYGLQAPAEVWRHTPRWLFFAWLLINLLVLFGELSHALVFSLAERAAPLAEHLPLLSGALGSLGVCLGVAMHCAWHAPHGDDRSGPAAGNGA